MEQLYYNLPFRWFVGLNMDDPVWDVTVFTKNRKRLRGVPLTQKKFLQALIQLAVAFIFIRRLLCGPVLYWRRLSTPTRSERVHGPMPSGLLAVYGNRRLDD